MRAAFKMWTNTGMIALVPAIAAFYAIAQIALAPVSVVLIPGVVQFKAANIFAMLLGLLFGPAGAWGVAIGNTIGDFFTGSLALGSFFGFWSSFVVPLVGYVGWSLLLRDGESWITRWNWRKIAALVLFGVLGAPVSAVVLAWGLEFLGIAPFQVISNILVVNFAIGSAIGVALFLLLAPRVHALHATWTDLMPFDGRAARKMRLVGLGLMILGGLAGWILGGVLGLTGAGLLVATGVCLALIVVGALLT